MEHLMAVILAAGEGKRMKSKNSKVVHKICERPLVNWVCKAVEDAGISDTIIVVGHRADQVKKCIGDKARYAVQENQLGTGHAVMQTGEYLKDKEGFVFILCGDTPLVTSQTLSRTLDYHKQNANSATVITAEIEEPAGYGRIVRNTNGDVLKIVEHRDATDEQRNIKEINSGMYCFTIKELLIALEALNNNNSQGEYYLTDTLEIMISKGLRVGAVKVNDPDEILGINDRVQLAEASKIMNKRILTDLMRAGVTIIDPASTYISDEAVIGLDSIVYPGSIIEGKTTIGEDCIIGPDARIVSSTIGNRVEINHSVVLESSVDDDTHVGPFAYIRPGSKIGKAVKIGDFVEVKKSVIGDKTKLSHLTYIGDAEIGENVNMGCGVVVVNYDGSKKHKTVVGDNAFVGCNVNLISPVTVKDNAYVAAGSTITEEVPENALAIARCRQVNKEDWVVKKGVKRK
ncbi:MAG: UDP-N-acetylglucosamine diphosphorylase/glucosamine-phosphate N-acetyltransferase [Clostridiales bacterium]|jgi:bifunctional UDP-N-acetylglucosamine pyrophosphorylase/glucosamine-1-phosphate N-acetyltransferase|nr:UDP-N-acetylglucosamine diphosphorylase/glucosamine-phosphate N-acetyltransferase [Clostridiales bacterium]